MIYNDMIARLVVTSLLAYMTEWALLAWHEVCEQVFGALMVKSQLFKMVKGVLSLAGPTNTQKDGVRESQLLQ